MIKPITNMSSKNCTWLRAGLVLGLVAALSCQAGSNYFLKIDGIDGESADEKHAGSIDIESWSWGVSSPGSHAGGGGGGAGKVHMQDLVVTRQLDKASPKLMLACATGQMLRSALLICRRTVSDGEPVEYYRIRLTDVLVTSVQTSGHSGESVPTESLSLNFAKIEWEYVPVDRSGRPEEPVRAEFDQRLNDPAN